MRNDGDLPSDADGSEEVHEKFKAFNRNPVVAQQKIMTNLIEIL